MRRKRVGERKLPGMEHLLAGWAFASHSIQRVAQDRMPDMLHMHAHLMRASAENSHGLQGEAPARVAKKRPARAIGDFAAGNDGHSGLERRVTAYGRLNVFFHPCRDAPDQGKIFLVHLVPRELPGQG